MPAKIIHSQSVQETWLKEEGCHIQEIGNTADDPDVSIARARVPPGQRTHWHSLRDTTERYLIIAGSGTVEIGELPPATVVAEDLVVIPPGVRQRITNNSNNDLVFYAVCSPRFTPDCYQDLEPDGYR
jgi:mannose-6-phosphate isomerase-like protein (cupin superfamily)